MKYDVIWKAVDNLAASLGLSPSGLAKKAGLDATTFNKSKRKRPDGKNRWPSLDSLNKIFEVCNITFEEFYNLGLQNEIGENIKAIPFCKLSKLRKNLTIHEDEVDTNNWKMISFPDGYNNLYALEIDTSDYLPLYREGTIVIVSKNSDIRRDDKIVIYTTDNQMFLAQFAGRTAKTIEVNLIAQTKKEISIEIAEVAILNRILWASQ